MRPAFAFRLLNGTIGKHQVIGAAKRAMAQSSVNQGDVSRLLVPKPDPDTQDEIVGILHAVETKATTHQRAKLAFTKLFHTHLHQLMTAQVRVQDLDLSALDGSTIGMAFETESVA